MRCNHLRVKAVCGHICLLLLLYVCTCTCTPAHGTSSSACYSSTASHENRLLSHAGMEDIAFLGSTETPSRTAGLHPATIRGREWFCQQQRSGQLPCISWSDVQRACTLKPCDGSEGECCWHAIGRQFNDVPQQPPEILSQAKDVFVQHLIEFVGPGNQSLESELPPESAQRLRTLALSEAAIPKDRDTDLQVLPATVGWTQENIRRIVSSRWFGMPWLGPATDWLRCNIAVWEVGVDGLQLYNFMQEVGLFLYDDGAPYMHLLYNSNCGEVNFDRVQTWQVRDSTSETLSKSTHNHFDNISMDNDFDPFATRTGGTPLPLEPGAGLPPLSTASQGSCEATYAGGRRAGDRCENPVKSDCGRFCNVHRKPMNSDKWGLLAKKASNGHPPPKTSAGMVDDEGSDGEPTGDLHDFEGQGSKMATEKERKKRKNKGEVEEEEYRDAYETVSSMSLACDEEGPEEQEGACCFSATGINLKDQEPDGDFEDSDDSDELPDGDVEAGDGEASDCDHFEHDIFANADGTLCDGDDGDGYEPDKVFRQRDGQSNEFSASDNTEASLPRPRKEDVAMINVDVMGALAFQFFLLMFPEAAVLLLVRETNAYATFCNQPVAPHGRTQRHSKKTLCLGGSTWPTDGITYDMMLGVIGIVITMGLVKLPEFSNHWCTGAFHDFTLVRQCMPRELFFLIYSRFFHMAPAGQPARDEEGFDSLHCIRPLETLLNSTWSSVCKPGRWISFDEQMVLCVSRIAKYFSRHMPKKPIKNGIKIWAVCCFTGYCFVGYTDGGFSGDPLLSQWLHCALGRTCRLVLFVLFIACPALGEHLKDSGTYMACDSYFSSPILFLCLKKRGIYAIGTLKSIHRGVLDVKTFWVENSQKLTKKGEMLFARFGNMAFVQWWDSRVVLFLTTIHLKIGRIEYRRRKAGLRHKLRSWQPWCRRTYNRFMGGVDIADQYNGGYMVEHRSRNYFWRRVFEQKLYQSLTNSWLLYCWWLLNITRKVDAAIAELSHGGADYVTVDGLNLAELQHLKIRLKALSKVKRVAWLRALSVYLMSACEEGNPRKGRRRQKVPTPTPTPGTMPSDNRPRLETLAHSKRAQCESRKCTIRIKGEKASRGRRKTTEATPRGSKVNTGCRCEDCKTVGGVVMCWNCHCDDAKHRSAFEHAASPRKNGGRRLRRTLEFEGDKVKRNKRVKKAAS